MSEAKTWHGSCHCGRIKFDVEGKLEQAIECNCSICRRKGTKLWFVPRAQLHLLTPEENMATYTFNTHRIKHRFCPTCGVSVFGEADKDGVPMAAVNVRCLDDVDLDTLPIHHFDGKSL